MIPVGGSLCYCMSVVRVRKALGGVIVSNSLYMKAAAGAVLSHLVAVLAVVKNGNNFFA